MLNRKILKAKASLTLVSALTLLAGMPSAQASVKTYNVTDTFVQVHPGLASKGNNTFFNGSFSFDNITNTVTWLGGTLSESMTGNLLGYKSGSYNPSYVVPQTLLSLNYMKDAQNDGNGTMLVSVFYKDSTDVFQGGGYATGGTKQYLDGNGIANNNAYVTFAFSLADPLAQLTQNQILKVAYGDCAAGGLMGTTCMTGYEKLNSSGAHIAGGTMLGTFPTTQTITAAVPEPETYAMFMAGLGLMGFVARRRKTA